MNAPMRLSQLSELIRISMQESFGWQRFWVVAEISNHSFYAQRGFHYFDLIETEAGAGSGERRVGKSSASLVAKISGVAWREGAMRISAFERETGQRFGNELQVLMEVSVDYHSVYGLKLTLQDIDSSFTLGQLELKKQATLQELLVRYPDVVWESAGQIRSANQEIYLPPVVQRIAVISSKTAAGYEDFLHSLDNNSFDYRFEIHPFYATVQGEQNAGELATAFGAVEERALELGLDYDVVVLIRGGGAATDLLIFDQFEVAAAIASCPFPVFTGIGHQKNETIADLMAHTAFKTPTKVAEFLIERNRGFETGIQENLYRIELLSRRVLAGFTNHLQELRYFISHRSRELLHQEKQLLAEAAGIVHKQPALLLQDRREELKQLEAGVQTGAASVFKSKQGDLDHLFRLFRMASPEKILARGFAIVKKNDQFIADPSRIGIGDTIQIILSGSRIDAAVEQKSTYNGDPFNI